MRRVMRSQKNRKWAACLMAMPALWLCAAEAYGQPTYVTIGGEVYSGTGTVTYTLDVLGNPHPNRNFVDKIAGAPPITGDDLDERGSGARVMIQDMEGNFVAYGTFTPGVNTWSADVPEGHEYVLMFSAPYHNLTSRVLDVRPTVLDASGATIANPNYATSIDAYLPALNLNITTGAVVPTDPPEPLANLLVYAFEEAGIPNGADDFPFDFGLGGVLIEVVDPKTGAVVQSGETICCGNTDGEGGGGTTTITTSDGLVFPPGMSAGLIYFTGLNPGAYIVRAFPPNYNYLPGAPDPTYGQVGLTSGAPLHQTDASIADFGRAWFYSTTIEGGIEWEINLYPGDPGTEAGGFKVWFGFVEHVAQDRIPPAIHADGTYDPQGTISGVIEDADVAWEAPMAGEPPEPGAPLDPAFINQGVSANGIVPNGWIALWTGNGETARLIATTLADPVTGEFMFTDVPPGEGGMYRVFINDIPLHYVFKELQIPGDGMSHFHFPLFANEMQGMPLAIIPRFGAVVRGFVVDQASGLGIPGATVNIRHQAGNVAFSTVTDANGWYEFINIFEIEVMAMIDVEPPAGYRGAIVTDTYYPAASMSLDPTCVDPGGELTGICNVVVTPCNPDPAAPNYDPLCVAPGMPYDVARNGQGRYIQWFTATYTSNLYLESVPAVSGQIQGYVFNDSLAKGTWVTDGVWDPVDEGTVEGVTIELLDGMGAVIDTTTSGTFDKLFVSETQGYMVPGQTVPADEWGGLFSGPTPGFFEFRDLAPGDYTVRVTLPTGFHPPVPCGTYPCMADYPVTVAAGARNDLDIGIHTLVPQAGQLEGGIFADNAPPGQTDLDMRWYSTFFMEKKLLVDLPVTVMDYLGYPLDVFFQPSGLCYGGFTNNPVTGLADGSTPVQYGNICDRPDLGYGVEIERRVAPGAHIYLGNDPNHPNYDPNWLPLEMTYSMGQGTSVYEADWSLIVHPGAGGAGGGGPVNAICVFNETHSSVTVEGTMWSPTLQLNMRDDIGPLPGATVLGFWSTGQNDEALADMNGTATFWLEKVENPNLDCVDFTVTLVDPPLGVVATFDPNCGLGAVHTVCAPGVEVPPPTVVAVLNGPAAGQTGQVLTFDGSQSLGQNMQFNWTFGDEGEMAGPATVTHTYAAAGTYLLIMQVVDTVNNVTDVAQMQVVITDPGIPVPLQAVINGADGGVPNQPLDADALQSTGGNILTYDWTFKDSTGTVIGTAIGTQVTRSYAAVGLYTVELTITDDLGGSSTDSILVTIDNPLLVTTAVIDGPTGGQVGQTLTFDGTQSIGGNLAFEWFIDGAPAGTADTLTHTFTATGAYLVSLKVTDLWTEELQWDQGDLNVMIASATPTITLTSGATDQGEGKWFAEVTLTLQFGGTPGAGLLVHYNWIPGEQKTATTDANGQFTIKSETIENGNITSIMFAVISVEDPNWDGSQVTATVNRPF